MSTHANPVSLHPYFQIAPEHMEQFETLMDEFVERTKPESGCIYYGFTRCGDKVLCREAYVDAAAVLHHLDNVGPILERALAISTLVRLELHGPADQIDQLRSPLAELEPDFYVHVTGLEK